MGTYLSTPVKDKGQEEGACLQPGEIPTVWGVVDMQGWRKSMEDAHVAQSFLAAADNKQEVTRCFAVFDGHGGAEVARFCALYLVAVWKRQIQQAASNSDSNAGNADCGEALKRTFHELDRMIDDEARRDELIRLRAIAPAPGEQRVLPPPLPENGDTNNKNSTVDDIEDDDSPPPQTMPSPPPPHSVTPPPPHKDHSINNADDDDDDADVESPPLQQDDDVVQTATESTIMAQTDDDDKEMTTLAVTPPPPDGKLAVPLGSISSEDSMDEEETDSQDAAGIQEAAELDQDISSDEEDDDDDNAAAHEKESSPPVIVENGDSPGTNGNTDKTDKYDDFTAKNKVVTSMFQRLLNLSGPSGQVVLQVDQSLAANNSGSPTTLSTTSTAATPPAQGPPATLIRNGQMLCNLADHPIHAGATAIVAVLQGRRLTVANAGDSRAVLCRAHGATKALSFDHKPMQQRELNRIKAAGGFVNSFGRVNGNLNLSRSIGDLKYKQTPGLPPEEQMITAEPDIEQ